MSLYGSRRFFGVPKYQRQSFSNRLYGIGQDGTMSSWFYIQPLPIALGIFWAGCESNRKFKQV